MALTDKDILITPNDGSSTADPKINYVGANSSSSDTITVETLFDGTKATLSFEGSAGQLFSIVNDLSSDPIFSVNDVSGVPSIEVNSNGNISLAEFSGNVGIGTSSPETKLHVFKGESGGAAANTDSSLVLENNSHTYVQFLTPTNKESGLLFGDNDNDNAALTYSHSTNNMTFRAAGANRMTLVGSSGNVGIGTTSPASLLDVAGTITTDNLTIQNLSAQNSEATALMINGGVVGFRELGANAFNSTTIPSISGLATESFVTTQINNLIDSAPGALNTLNELAAAIGDDSNFSTTITNSIATKLPLAGGTMTGDITMNGNDMLGTSKITLNANPTGTSYGGTSSSTPANMISQVVGGNDGWRLYGEGASNDVQMIFEIVDDLETGDTWVFRNKKTYSPFTSRNEFIITGEGTFKSRGQGFVETSQRVFADNYHPNADKLTTARTIAGTSFDGTANIDINYNNLTNKPTIPTNNNQLTNGAGYLTASSTQSKYLRSDQADTASGSITILGNNNKALTIGDGSARREIKINSSQWPEVTFYNAGTENARIGTAQANSTYNTAAGDFYVYCPSTDKMNLIVPKDGGSFTRFNGAHTVWDSGNDGSGSGLDADTLDGQHASAFLTSFTEANLFLGDGGNASTHPGTSKVIYSGQVSAGGGVLGMPTINNANAFLNLNKHSGNYNSQLGFSSNGNIYYRNFNNTAINSTQAFRLIWDSGNDGSGSGLDADTVDGIQASSFVRGDQSNAINLTITGVMQANNGYKVSSNTVIDSSRNITAGTISSGAITSTGLVNTFYSGSNTGNLRVGRNTTQALELYVDDGQNKITAKQDSDSNGTHRFILDREFDGTGPNFFHIRKGGSNQFTIDTNGKVGIATATPTHPLHVHMDVSNDTIDETKGLVKFQSTGGNGMIFGTIASSPYTSYIQSAYVVDTSLAQYNIALNPIGGNVGIGNTTPQRRLTVTEGSAGGASDNSGILSLTVGSGANTDSKMAFGIDSNHKGWIHVVKPGNNVMPLILNPTNSSNGKVGIGTMNPGERLSVSPDSDVSAEIGRAHVGYIGHGDYAGFSHVDQNTGTRYALIQSSSGQTFLNAAAGNAINFRINNAGMMVIDSNGNINMGATSSNRGDVGSVNPKLYVNQSGTDGAYNLAARFRAGNDNDNTGASILINHSNDRGLLIEAGRQSSDRGIAYLGVVNSGGTNKRLLTLWQDGSAYKVGIGTTTPGSKLHIASDAVAADDLTLLTLENGNSTGDIATPNTFIDFKFTDSNSNVTPQARIGAHAGDGGDANSQEKEGKGYLTFHTSDTTATSGTVATQERVRITHQGDLIVNNKSSNDKSKIGDDQGNSIEMDGANFEMDFNLDTSTMMKLQDNGRLHCDNDVVAFSTTVSDERLKDKVITIDGALNKVLQLRGVEYTWNNTAKKGKRDLGVIAQEVEEVLPEIVQDTEMPLIDGETYKTVDYEKITGVLIEAIKEQQTIINRLEDRLKNIENKNGED